MARPTLEEFIAKHPGRDPYPVCVACAEGAAGDKPHTCTIPKETWKTCEDSSP